MRRPLTILRGISAARAATLAKEAGIENAGDLLYHFPYRYLDRNITEGALLQPGQNITIEAQIESSYLAHGRRSRLIARCRTKHGVAINLLWFGGVHYLKNIIKKGALLIVSGKLEGYRKLQMTHPDFELFDPQEERQMAHVGRIIPLYSTSEAMKRNRLDSRTLRRLTLQILEEPALQVEEILPAPLLQRRGLLDRREALFHIHFPESQEKLQAARHYLKYEELFLLSALIYYRGLHRRQRGRSLYPLAYSKSKQYNSLLQRLPFTLTGDQKRAIEQILPDNEKNYADSFLLQGDVGSGKTVVALGVALHYMETEIQSALMAPTEVLARQHFLTISNLIGMESAYRVELLTAADKGRQRAAKLERIASGEAALVVGTHSLIEKEVRFSRLGLVIVDEQHRFGVSQRETLRSKGQNPDMIAMTATPIPRSLCLTEFADLTLVTLREKPLGRKPIETMWLPPSRRKGIHLSIRKHVSTGRQCYIVYPLIEDSEKIDLKAATEAYRELSEEIFPDFQVALLHGRLKAAEKEQIMRHFRSGNVQVLVTTSVIEVGVDVPNATVMIIEHAERFGISQLHQLRGRVGRSTLQSYCVLVSEGESDEARHRLKAVAASEDGFYLSEVDLKIRGAGEILGLKQHGFSGLRLADLSRDRLLVEEVHSDLRTWPEINDEGRAFIGRRFKEGVVSFPN